MAQLIAIILVLILIYYVVVFIIDIFYWIVPFVMFGSGFVLFLSAIYICNSIYLSYSSSAHSSDNISVQSKFNASVFVMTVFGVIFGVFYWLNSYPDEKYLGGFCFPCTPHSAMAAGYICSDGLNKKMCESSRPGEFYYVKYSRSLLYFTSRSNRGAGFRFDNANLNLAPLLDNLKAGGWEVHEVLDGGVATEIDTTDYSKPYYCTSTSGKQMLCTTKTSKWSAKKYSTIGFKLNHPRSFNNAEIKLDSPINESNADYANLMGGFSLYVGDVSDYSNYYNNKVSNQQQSDTKDQFIENPKVILAEEKSAKLSHEIKAPIQSLTPWTDPEWKSCVTKFKGLTHKENVYRYINGYCGASSAQLDKLEPNSCFMKIIAPSAIRNANEYEIQLVCIWDELRPYKNKYYRNEQTICTDRKNYYKNEIYEKMKRDSRCLNFPNLNANDIAASSSRFSEEEIVQINKHAKTGVYEDLPLSIRYENNNADLKCQELVGKVRLLENHPQFQSEESIRLLWEEQFKKAANLGCEL